MADLQEQIKKTQEQIERLTNQKKRLLSRQKEVERKQRTKRLIERGAILENAIGNATDFSNEQIQTLLIEVFSNDEARTKIEKMREETEREGNPLS